MLRRTGAAAPPFGLPQNRPMPFRVPGTHAGRRAQTEVASDSGKVPTQQGSPTARGPAVKAKRHRQDVHRQNIDKTAAGKHQQDKPPTARESPAAQRAPPARRGHWQRGGDRSFASRRSVAREPPQHASLLEHEGHQRNAIYRANSARQARRTPQDSPRAKSILNSRGSLGAFRRAGPGSQDSPRACESPQDSWKNSPSSEPADLMVGKGLRAD